MRIEEKDMTQVNLGGSFTFAGTPMNVNRVGYGAMRLAGEEIWGMPKDVDEAKAVLRTAVTEGVNHIDFIYPIAPVELRTAVTEGVNHIDTADFYGPHVANQLIRESLHPYSEELVIVTGEKGGVHTRGG
ncbi:MAG TPA: aldo/keto reductase [Edaphobacter sp.]|nr:aldo/keto reductase [Edaphobacter sp.]